MSYHFTTVLLFLTCLLFLNSRVGFAGEPDCNNHVAFFVFGDSLMDTGNSNYLNTTPNFQGNYYPYGETFFRYASGRTTDGRVIPDYISEFAGIPLSVPYFFPGHKDFTHGANFGSGGAGVLVNTLPTLVLSLHRQVGYFMTVADQLTKEVGASRTSQILSNAVYLFAVGSNDYVTPYIQNSTFLNAFTPEEYVAMVVGNYTGLVRDIYNRGGRKFAFLDFGDLGCLPISRANSHGGCIKILTTYTTLHNALFKVSIGQLSRQLPGFKYALMDYHNALNQRTNNPTQYGFEEGRSACCGTGPYRGINSCGGRKAVKEYELCPDPSKYVFFDAGHLTDAIYGQFAHLLWSGAPDVVAPYNLQSLFKY